MGPFSHWNWRIEAESVSVIEMFQVQKKIHKCRNFVKCHFEEKEIQCIEISSPQQKSPLLCAGGAPWATGRLHPWGLGLRRTGPADLWPQEGPERRRAGAHRGQRGNRWEAATGGAGGAGWSTLLILRKYGSIPRILGIQYQWVLKYSNSTGSVKSGIGASLFYHTVSDMEAVLSIWSATWWRNAARLITFHSCYDFPLCCGLWLCCGLVFFFSVVSLCCSWRLRLCEPSQPP